MPLFNTLLLLIPTLGPMELVIILVIIIVLFGANRLPQIGKGIGEGIKNFKRGMKDAEEPDDEPQRLAEKTPGTHNP
ncbi:MAG TPA: twin-arginine translocase TatA/TatE family subunit [Thermoanaerobaculia bacterium]|nr:twin-arginine translocase TatA/TatE family subunit [Thermoanaerobaculia bacterium]